MARSSLRVFTVALALGGTTLSLTGCNFIAGKSSDAPISSASGTRPNPTPSQPSKTQDPEAAKANACAVFIEASTYSNVANHVFDAATDDPKRTQNYDKPSSDAADSAHTILNDVADAIQQATTPQVSSDLASKLQAFVSILRERAQLFDQHAGTDELDANGDKYAPAGKELNGICQPYKDVKPTPVAPSGAQDPQQAKQDFCTVYKKEKTNANAVAKRFSAAAKGDQNHPHTSYDDADGWLAGAAADGSIINKYAADNIEGAIAPALSADIVEKAKYLVEALRKLADELNKQAAFSDIKNTSANEYAPPADALDSMCGIS